MIRKKNFVIQFNNGTAPFSLEPPYLVQPFLKVANYKTQLLYLLYPHLSHKNIVLKVAFLLNE